MRIISGKYKGREIKGYDLEGTRPTQARVKESLFAKIQDYLQDSCCLDLFAGSGNLGIEALSNGAKSVVFVDASREAVSTIKENLRNFSIDNCVLYHMDYQKALAKLKEEGILFDVIFLDPPYKKEYIKHILPELKNSLLKENGIVVCEVSDKTYLETSPFPVFKEGKYNDKWVVIFKKTLYNEDR